MNEGFIMEATYVNDGPNSVFWGFTSADEMMLMVYFYLTDTAGLGSISSIGGEELTSDPIRVYPNPVVSNVTFELPQSEIGQSINMRLYDGLGREVAAINDKRLAGTRFMLNRGDLPEGLYLFEIQTSENRTYSGKLLFR